MYKQKGRATSSSNISYGPSQALLNTLSEMHKINIKYTEWITRRKN